MTSPQDDQILKDAADTKDDFYRRMNGVINDIADLNKMAVKERLSPWISIVDRLPNEDGRYLCATWLHMDMTQNIEICSYSGGLFSDHNVTHWIPLPSQPKGNIS